MLNNLKAIPAMGLVMLLSACGGGGDADIGTSSTGTQTRPTVWTVEGRYFNSCQLSPGCSGNPYAPFFSYASAAPENGATLSGKVRLELRGNEMANAELLPANGYTPVHARFNITGDRTLAWLDLDTTTLPNGPFNARVSTYNVPPGQAGGNEIAAMPARTWSINNPVVPPAAFTAAVAVAPANGAVVSGITRLEVRGSGIVNAELLPANGYTPRLGVFNVSTDKTVAWLDFDTRSLPDGVRDVRIAAYNVAPGQSNGAEIIAMPARRWQFANGTASSAPFTATVTMAPAHGAIVTGQTLLEVRGTGIQNVELLPATGYAPQLGVFNISADRTYAYLQLDTASLPPGTLNARISAFSVPAGQPNGREIIAMPARQWELRR
ncbi:hypothetical protein [Noviherbaspirillum sp.]|uniref:hypothetical protein n=1 Tax=Noviherbaspirillum sp. TaxID=1926288 RepID=UPI002FE163DA